MDCQYCGKIFTSDYNPRRHEGEYCPDRDNDGKECSPPKESRDADEASILSNESMGTHASHDDVDEDTVKGKFKQAQDGEIREAEKIQRKTKKNKWRKCIRRGICPRKVPLDYQGMLSKGQGKSNIDKAHSPFVNWPV